MPIYPRRQQVDIKRNRVCNRIEGLEGQVRRLSVLLIVVDVLNDLNGDDDGDDYEQDEENTEAYPSLLASCTSGVNSLLSVLKTVEKWASERLL